MEDISCLVTGIWVGFCLLQRILKIIWAPIVVYGETSMQFPFASISLEMNTIAILLVAPLAVDQ